MASMVRKAGMAMPGLFHWISVTLVIIMLPTMMSAGAVAAEGMAPARGATKSAAANRRPVTMAVTPERPPAATPAELSI
jgi:hypothetical protein